MKLEQFREIADENLSDLNVDERMLQDLHREGNTVILITHDNGIAATAERVIRLDDGKVVYDGPATNPDAFVQANPMLDKEVAE